MQRDQLIETLYKAMGEALANVHTATVARVTAVGATTISCQPIIARVVEGKTVQLPEFINVPPVFLKGGATYTAYPIAVGDYALLVFTERCFDNWYNGADGQPPADFRMHDYSDGFVIVGIMPGAGAIPIPVDIVKRVGDSEVIGDYDHMGNYVLNGNLIVNGNLTFNGQGSGGTIVMNNTDITLTDGDFVADGISLKHHVHDGVQPGSGNTGEPV